MLDAILPAVSTIYHPKVLLLRDELSRKTEKLITSGRVHYLELTEFPLIPQDRLQKKAVFNHTPLYEVSKRLVAPALQASSWGLRKYRF